MTLRFCLIITHPRVQSAQSAKYLSAHVGSISTLSVCLSHLVSLGIQRRKKLVGLDFLAVGGIQILFLCSVVKMSTIY